MAATGNVIEDQLALQAGIYAAVEETTTDVVLSGLISSEEQRQAALDIVAAMMPSKRIVDNLEVVDIVPEFDRSSGPAETQDAIGASDVEAIEPGDFTAQLIQHNALGASGPSGFTDDEDVSEGDDVYVPPTDPVLTPEGEILGGFQLSSDDSIEIETSTTGAHFSDSAIATAIRRELMEDSATTDLEIHVSVENGVAELRGTVTSLDDAENAEAVANRVPGVVEVRENLAVENLQ